MGISVEPSTTSVSSCPSLSSMTCSERSEVPATSREWSTCSRTRWLETTTTPMNSSSRPSWPTTPMARSTSRCSSTPLKTWGDKMTTAEIDDIFNEFEVDEDYMCKTKEVMGLFVAVKEEEKKVEEKKEEVAEEAPAEDEGDAKKKKKKKKKAAK